MEIGIRCDEVSFSLLKRAKSWQSAGGRIEAVKFAPLGPSHVCSRCRADRNYAQRARRSISQPLQNQLGRGSRACLQEAAGRWRERIEGENRPCHHQQRCLLSQVIDALAHGPMDRLRTVSSFEFPSIDSNKNGEASLPISDLVPSPRARKGDSWR